MPSDPSLEARAPAHDNAASQFNQHSGNPVAKDRILAVGETGAKIAHQINEPLTALLLHLREIKRDVECRVGTERILDSMGTMVDRALRETERVCDIMERLESLGEVPVDAETALARRREVLALWAGTGNGNGHSMSAPSKSALQNLTPREREVLAVIVEGSSNKEGALRLGISSRTFEVHRAHIMRKLDAKNAADLVRRALIQAR